MYSFKKTNLNKHNKKYLQLKERLKWIRHMQNAGQYQVKEWLTGSIKDSTR
jgi:hypothetical protein